MERGGERDRNRKTEIDGDRWRQQRENGRKTKSRQSSYQGNRASQQPANKARPGRGERGTEFDTAGKTSKTQHKSRKNGDRAQKIQI